MQVARTFVTNTDIIPKNDQGTHRGIAGRMLMLSLENDHMKLFCDLGLTPNQAKAYMTILRQGAVSIGTISKASGVRREEISRMLPKLEKMGLTEKVLGAPVKIRAIPPESAFTILIEKAKAEANRKLSQLAVRSDEFREFCKTSRKRVVPEE